MLGSLMLQQGRDQEAELFFRSQVKATPEDPAASEKLASALARQGRYEEAATCMRRVIELKPDSGSAFLTICGYNAQAGSIREAVDDFKQAYLRLGARIIQLSYDSNFDKIRDTPEFKEVIEKASMELARPMRIQSYQEEMPGIGMDAFPVPEDASQ
jgi:tetratricopeptide (TPR) repeat protein